VGRGSSAHLPLHTAHLKGLVFTFDGKNKKQWGRNMQYWMTFTLSCEYIEVSFNICRMIHGLGIFGPIISKLVCELTFNPLLLFHHVVHIPKYSLLELM
jgi:hypothetical protein